MEDRIQRFADALEEYVGARINLAPAAPSHRAEYERRAQEAKQAVMDTLRDLVSEVTDDGTF